MQFNIRKRGGGEDARTKEKLPKRFARHVVCSREGSVSSPAIDGSTSLSARAGGRGKTTAVGNGSAGNKTVTS